MNLVKLGFRISLFVLFLVVSTVLVEYAISAVYLSLVDYYSLPKSDSDITFLAFIISLFFVVMLTIGSGYWRGSKVF